MFDSAAAGGVIFRAATELDEHAFAAVQACVRRRPLRVFVRGDRADGEITWLRCAGSPARMSSEVSLRGRFHLFGSNSPPLAAFVRLEG